MRTSAFRRAALRRMVESCEPRRLLAAVSWDGGGDGTNWFDANNWSANALPSGSDDVTIDVAANPTIVLNSNASVRSIVNRETLRISSTGSSIQLSVSTTVLNAGRIELTSTGNSSSSLSASGELTNAAGATLTALQGVGGPRSLNASSIVSAGTISSADSVAFNLNATNTSITGGTLSAGTGGTSSLRFTSSNYAQTGGAVSGRVQAYNGTISLGGSATGTLLAVGGNTLTGHTAAGLTLNLQYDPSFGGNLAINSDLALTGPITLDTLSTGNPSISIGANRTLTVGATGSITGIGTGAGTTNLRSITGTTGSRLVNDGLISATGGAQLSVTSLIVDQRGTLSTANAGSRVNFNSTTFNYLGGTHAGDILLGGSNRISLVDASGNVSIRSVGGNTLVQHAATEITLALEYDPSIGGNLAISSDVTVAGPITLSTLSTTAPSISIGAGYALTLGPTGTITALGSGAGTTTARNITGTTNSVFVNQGTLAATGGSQLAISGLRFTQEGSITASGAGSQVIFGSNDFVYAGGTHSGDVILLGGNNISLIAAASPLTLSAVGSNTLVRHDAQNLTLGVLYTPATGASLIVSSDVTINGAITLNTLTTSSPSLNVNAGYTLTLGPTGSITALGSGAGTTLVRNIFGSTNSRIVNNGTLTSTGGAELTFSSVNLDNNNDLVAAANSLINFSSATLVQNGDIDASATGARIRVGSSRFEYQNGTHSGDFGMSNSSILLVDAASALTLNVFGSNTLLGHTSSDLTLNVLYTQSQGGSLSISTDQTLGGAITMSTETASTPSITIAAGYVLTIAPTGSIAGIAAAPGGTTADRTINGSTNSRIINNGLLLATGGATVNFSGLRVDNNATVQADANSRVRFSSGRLDQSGTITASAAGAEIIVSGAFNYLAGTHAGNVFADSASIRLVDAASPVTLITRGSSTLIGHDSNEITLYVRYDPSLGANLNVATDQTLNGAITLGSIGTSQPTLSVNAALFTISPTGSITAIASESGTAINRAFNGTTNTRVVNNGLITATGGSTLTLSSMRLDNNAVMRAQANSKVIGSSMTLNQSGTLEATAVGSELDVQSSTLNYLGGSHAGNVYATSTSIRLVDSAAPLSLVVRGSSTLIEHNTTKITLYLRYDAVHGANLSINTDQTLIGPITLGSNGNSSPNITLSAATLTIAPTGSITAIAPEAGTALSRTLSASTNARIINNGLIASTGGTTFTLNSARVDNNGTVRADAGSNVTFGSGVFNQNALLNASAAGSSIYFSSSAFNYLDGTHTGEVAAISSSISLVSSDAAGIFYAYGSNTLLQHASPQTTLDIRYHPQFGGNLVINSNILLSGPITMDTLTQSPPSISIGAGLTLTITSAGSIAALGTPSGTTTNARSISGSTNSRIINQGSISAQGGSQLNISSLIVDQRAAISTTDTGSRVTFSSGTFNYLNGSNSGNVFVVGERVRLANATATSRLYGNGVTLLEHADADITLEMLGGGLSNEGDLTIFGPVILSSDTNIGVASVNMPAGTDLTIAPTGSLTFALGTNTSTSRSFSGTTNTRLINNGLIAIDSGLTLSISFDSTAAMLNAGTISLAANGTDTTNLTVSGGSGLGLLNSAAGTIRKTGSGTATLNSVRFDNKGLVDITGGTLRFPGATNIDDPTGTFLSGGTYRVAGGATLGFSTSPSLRPAINTADVEVAGSGVVEFARLAINRGRLALTGSADLTVDPDGASRFVNEGIFDVGPGSDLTIVGGLDFAGTSQPVIRTELASASSFGRVLVTGSVNLNSPNSASRFDPDLVNGYDPALGSRHDVIVATAGIINGFDSFQGGLTPSNLVLQATRPNTNTVAVEVGPGPLPPPPQVLSQVFDFQTREAVVFTFNQDVSAFLSRKDYQLVNLTTNTPVASTVGLLSYNAASNQAVLTFTNELPDGSYRLTVNASDIANSSGVPASGAPIVLDFFILKGDVNRDRTVNFDDLLVVAQNYGTSGKTFTQGNFNYDSAGTVGFDDLLLLAQRYGISVLQTTSLVPSPSTAGKRGSIVENVIS